MSASACACTSAGPISSRSNGILRISLPDGGNDRDARLSASGMIGERTAQRDKRGRGTPDFGGGGDGTPPRMEKREFRRRVLCIGRNYESCTIRSLRRQIGARNSEGRKDGKAKLQSVSVGAAIRHAKRRRDKRIEKHEGDRGDGADGRTTILTPRRQGAPSRDIIHLQGIILLLADRPGRALARARVFFSSLPFFQCFRVLPRALAFHLSLSLSLSLCLRCPLSDCRKNHGAE